jgi:hypothetical protein
MANVAGQFSSLPMEDLIGGPLQAAATAQGKLASITSEFIENVGLQDDGQGNLSARTVDLQVPLLTIVKAPNLQVKEVNVTFDMEVKASTASQSTSTRAASVSASWKGWGAKVKFQGSVSNKQESQRSSDTSAKYHVDVKAVDEGAPEGLMKVLDILNEAIQPAQ